METIGQLSIVWTVFLVVMAIIWFFLPFAIFGVKRRLDDLIRLEARTNKYLKILADAQAKENKAEQEEAERQYKETHPDKIIIDGKPYDLIQAMTKYNIEKNGEKFIFFGQEFSNINKAIEAAREVGL